MPSGVWLLYINRDLCLYYLNPCINFGRWWFSSTLSWNVDSRGNKKTGWHFLLLIDTFIPLPFFSGVCPSLACILAFLWINKKGIASLASITKDIWCLNAKLFDFFAALDSFYHSELARRLYDPELARDRTTKQTEFQKHDHYSGSWLWFSDGHWYRTERAWGS